MNLFESKVSIIKVNYWFHFYILFLFIQSQAGFIISLDMGRQLGAFLSFFKLLLSLAELGKVQGSNLLSFLNLLLVGLDLLLELAGKVGHSVLVLLVFILGKLELLGLAVSSLASLHVLRGAGLDRSKLRFQLTDSGLKLSHSSLSTSHGSSFSISQSSFKVTKRGLQGALGSSLAVGMILLRSKLISKASSINHSLLGLLLRVLSSLEHGINLSLESVDLSLKTSFGSHVSGVDGLHLIASRSGVRDLHVKLALSSLSRVKEGTALLNLTREGSSLALSNTSLLIDLLALAGLILKGLDGFSQLSLVSLDGLESLSIGLVCMVKSNFKLIDISLKFLLDAKSFSLGSLFSFQGSSKRLHGTLVVLTSVVELFLLLSNSSVNFLADLAKLQLSSQDLVLLLLKSSLSLLKSTLELFLLLLKSSALLVKVMDGASTISKLVKEILDFISK